ncbi:MAG: CDP-alcohol phosphatidyltransferase family protein, partial [Candidatus Lutacidiplasmatales archaeon]|nr:CDP-alcohol phosphatidyltransferase family protein [Thermoplasmata archaeon]
MVLESYRARVQPYVARMARPFLGWDPGTLSVVALLLAVAAGVLAFLVRWTTPYLFLPVALLIFFSGVFDVLDGAVARATGRTSVRGDFVDHVFDRYADVAILLGIALSTFASPFLALLALVSLLLTSYMGTQAQAVGQGRLYAGLLSRTDRLVVLALATFLEFDWSLPWPWAASLPWSRFHWGGVAFTVIDVALVYFVIAGQWTAAARALRVYRALPPPK